MGFENVRTREDLITAIAENGGVPKYVFFWGHNQDLPPLIDKSCLSQWYLASFSMNSICYPTAEHFMMAQKARLFNDNEILNKILVVDHPHEAKKLGRLVANYSDEEWKENRFEYVIQGNVAKFSQNSALKEFLLNTGKRVLVEASPRDTIWGIGMGAKNENATNPTKWRGLNLLGFALMEARKRIAGQWVDN